MAASRGLGQFELVALLAAMRLGDEAYGVSIAEEIDRSTGRAVALATLYLTLDRLEADGLIRSELGDPTAERGGRAKRYFRATAKGVREVQATRRLLTRMWARIPALRGETT